MTKITFRADDDLVERLDGLDTSKSEAMREALRQYLDQMERDDADEPEQSRSTPSGRASESGLDAALSVRVEALVDERLDERLPTLVDDAVAARTANRASPSELNVNINVDGADTESDVNARDGAGNPPNEERKTPEKPAYETESTCEQCGESVGTDHVYCPNCGEKASHRVFCECGDELRSDWAFCPDCGRRTPAANVLD